ncbi:MAG: uroporphyrinogen-III C-methyltransferase [Gammaproteobacteria bacterium]|nr:uroporphyrinogen-III C-methyltransferase [Gammaproteobacteria bacterium]
MPMHELAGIGVLITRPAHQARGLAERIEALGGTAVAWPTLDIVPPQDPAAAERTLARLAEFDVLVFVSANAVSHGLALLSGPLPAGIQVAVVGDGTARAVAEQTGRPPALRPATRFDSEGLLALPELQDLHGRQVLIVRGEGGRALLGETLRARGATVEYAEVYGRAVPAAAPAAALQALAEGRVQVVTATSSEGLRNLVAMAGVHTPALLALPLVVGAERQRRTAAELGFHGPIIVAENADDASIAAAVVRCVTPGGREGMSEDNDTPQSAATETMAPDALVGVPDKPTDGNRRSGRLLGATALVLALAAGAAAAWLWNELERTRAEAGAAQAALAGQIDTLQSATARQAAELDSVLRDTQEALTQRQALKAAVDDLRMRLARDRSDWQLAEVDYLLTIANRRLRFERDIPAAIAALEEADGRLRALQDPAMVPVREAIAGELESLRAVPGVDRSGLALKVTALMHGVAGLPLSAELDLRPAGEAEANPATGVADWRELFTAMWQDIKGLVTVRRRDEPVQPLLPPEQRFYLQQNLVLKLETARLALLQGEATVYRTALDEAERWTREYFNTGTASGEAFLQSLARLQQEQIAPDLPDIGGSLRTLRRTVRELTPPRVEGEA